MSDHEWGDVINGFGDIQTQGEPLFTGFISVTVEQAARAEMYGWKIIGLIYDGQGKRVTIHRATRLRKRSFLEPED